MFILRSLFLFIINPWSPSEGYTPSTSLSSEEIAGIWRLSSKRSLLPRQTLPCTTDQQNDDDDETEEELLLNLNEDGSFVQYADNEAAQEIGSASALLRGTWDFSGTKLVLAPDRPSHSTILQVNDTIIVGKVTTQIRESLVDNPVVPVDNGQTNKQLATNDSDVYLSVPKGKVFLGKFFYPKRHPSFFDQPMFQPMRKGTVQLRQILGILNTQRRQQEQNDATQIERFKLADFHGKKFILTSMPVQPKRKTPELKWNRKQGRYIPKEQESQQQPIDLRIIPIEFFANNTFCATGASKILRGRYGITGDEKDQIWFQVSLFGAGRSAPGSVYSEGNGLTHEDRRSYLGTIKHREGESGASRQILLVEGSAVVGSDLGSDARPEPVAHFTMREVDSFSLDDEGDDGGELGGGDSDYDSSSESIFE